MTTCEHQSVSGPDCPADAVATVSFVNEVERDAYQLALCAEHIADTDGDAYATTVDYL